MAVSRLFSLQNFEKGPVKILTGPVKILTGPVKFLTGPVKFMRLQQWFWGHETNEKLPYIEMIRTFHTDLTLDCPLGCFFVRRHATNMIVCIVCSVQKYRKRVKYKNMKGQKCIE